MDDDWAVKAAKEATERDRIKTLNLEKSSRESLIKNEVGPAFFRTLQEWMKTKVGEFNSIRRNEELVVTTSAQANSSFNTVDSLISVRPSDGSRQPLKVTYSVSTHTINYEYGQGHGDFKLNVAKDDSANFETTFHKRISPEEMGAEMLDKFMISPR
jgi:hypothetical protein